MQYYQYGYSNPVNVRDPSGECAAPPSSSGDVICVAFFIAAARIGPGGIGLGDNRTFSTHSEKAPAITGGSRAYLYIYLTKEHQFRDAKPNINPSFVQPLIPLVDPYTSVILEVRPFTISFGPYYQYEQFTAREMGGAIQVDWHLLNGATGALRDLRDKGIKEALDSSHRSGGPFCFAQGIGNAVTGQLGIWLSHLDAIDGTMSLEYLRSPKGRYRIKYLQRDPYPSMEVYFYHNGRYQYTIYQHAESALGPEKGLLSSAPREIVDNRNKR